MNEWDRRRFVGALLASPAVAMISGPFGRALAPYPTPQEIVRRMWESSAYPDGVLAGTFAIKVFWDERAAAVKTRRISWREAARARVSNG